VSSTKSSPSCREGKISLSFSFPSPIKHSMPLWTSALPISID
jgi:hypothetical protein